MTWGKKKDTTVTWKYSTGVSKKDIKREGKKEPTIIQKQVGLVVDK